MTYDFLTCHGRPCVRAGQRQGLALVIPTAMALMVLSGCVTPTVTQEPVQPIDFSRFKTVAYLVHTVPGTDFGQEAGPTGSAFGLFANPPEPDTDYAPRTLKVLEKFLGQKLAAMGYATPLPNASPDLTIDVAVTSVRPLVGGPTGGPIRLILPANHATLLFTATFKDSTGTPLAVFKGGWIYTDAWEIWSYYMRESEIPEGCSWRAVSQIEEFMRNGGRFPKRKEPKTQ